MNSDDKIHETYFDKKFEILFPDNLNYDNLDLFRSEICHWVQKNGDLKFVYNIYYFDIIDKYWYADRVFEAIYLLAMVDYLSRLNSMGLYFKYDKLREIKLKERYYPYSIELLDKFSPDVNWLEKAWNEAIPEFKRVNIVEAKIEEVA